MKLTFRVNKRFKSWHLSPNENRKKILAGDTEEINFLECQWHLGNCAKTRAMSKRRMRIEGWTYSTNYLQRRFGFHHTVMGVQLWIILYLRKEKYKIMTFKILLNACLLYITCRFLVMWEKSNFYYIILIDKTRRQVT